MSMNNKNNLPPSGIDSTSDYLNEMGARDLIDGEREVELALAIRAAIEAQEILQLLTTDPDVSIASLTSLTKEDLEFVLNEGYAAQEEFIKANLRLVAKVAGMYVGHGVDYLELIQEGNIALMRAVNDFDPDLGNKFSTLAYTRLRAAMQVAIANLGRTVKVPLKEHRLSIQYKRVKQEVKSDDPYLLGSEIREICAERIGCSIEELKKLEMGEWSTANPRSIDAAIGSDDSDLSLADVVGNNDQAIAALHDFDFDQLTEGLEDRQREILRMRICEDLPLSKVAERIGISGARVQQIETKALYRIRGRIVSGELNIDFTTYPVVERIVRREQKEHEASVVASRIIPNIHRYGIKSRQNKKAELDKITKKVI